MKKYLPQVKKAATAGAKAAAWTSVGTVLHRISARIAERTALSRFNSSTGSAVALGAATGSAAVFLAWLALRSQNAKMANQVAPFLFAGAFLGAADPVVDALAEKSSDTVLGLLPGRIKNAAPGLPAPTGGASAQLPGASFSKPAPVNTNARGQLAAGGILADVGDVPQYVRNLRPSLNREAL